MAKGFWKGTSVLEIGFVAAVLLSLVAFTIPNFRRLQCQAVQSEARWTLGQIAEAQALARMQTGQYFTLEQLLHGDRVSLRDRFYRYETVGEPDAKTYEIQALGLTGTKVAGDIWTVNEKQKITNVRSVCTK